MKPCHYCGSSNEDAASHCAECGLAVEQVDRAPPRNAPVPPTLKAHQVLPRDRPKPALVAGIWFLFLPPLLGDLYLLWVLFHEPLFGPLLPPLLLATVGFGALSGYLLFASARNYQIQKARMRADLALERSTAPIETDTETHSRP